jgi:hypothetical protein
MGLGIHPLLRSRQIARAESWVMEATCCMVSRLASCTTARRLSAISFSDRCSWANVLVLLAEEELEDMERLLRPVEAGVLGGLAVRLVNDQLEP